MSKPTVEMAYKSDWDEIMAVWEASVRATHDFLHPDDIDYYKNVIWQYYLDAVYLYCVKGEDGKIAGFMGVAEDMLEMLFVRPDKFGQGIGKTLVDFAISTLRVYKVDVNEDNPKAIAFYKSLGYKAIGRSAVDSEKKNYPIIHMEYQ